MANDPQTKRLLWFVFAGSRGGPSRMRIIRVLEKSPRNTNQLSVELGMDYKAVQHHLRMLERNNLVSKEDKKYGVAYSISTFLEVNAESLGEVAAKLDKSK